LLVARLCRLTLVERGEALSASPTDAGIADARWGGDRWIRYVVDAIALVVGDVMIFVGLKLRKVVQRLREVSQAASSV